MAETTDRPPGSEGVIPAEAVPAAPPASETYRPLSLVALGGFLLAVAYALVVLVGGAVALFGRVPWLMPTWTFAVPVAAVVLCALARSRILNSEGTLSGQAFATWGLRLTVVVALSYVAYYTFTFFAVRLQAIDCADQFFRSIQEGKPERAFLLAQGVSVKEFDDARARSEVEGRFNSAPGPPGTPGPYTQFRQSQLVRAIESAGGDVRITPLGVAEWDYTQGGYRVQLRYQVVTPLSEFDMIVDTVGRDPKPGEAKGRQWQVMLQRGNTHILPETMKMTPTGEELTQAATMAQSFARSWQDKVNRRQWDEVYLDTRKPSERAALRKGQAAARLRQTAAVTGPVALGRPETAGRDFEADRKALLEGGLIRVDEKTFWSVKGERDAILRTVRDTFRPKDGGDPQFTFRIQRSAGPVVRLQSDRITFRLDSELTYSDERGFTTYVVEGYLLISADREQAASSTSAWWVDGIEASSGRTPPRAPERPGGPAGRTRVPLPEDS